MTATATATFLRIEVRRTLRSPRYALFTIGVPVGLFLVLASLYGSGTQDGISGTAWIMVSMSVFGVRRHLAGLPAARVRPGLAAGRRRALGPAAAAGRVRNYLSAAITKTGTRNRVEALRVAEGNGWL